MTYDRLKRILRQVLKAWQDPMVFVPGLICPGIVIYAAWQDPMVFVPGLIYPGIVIYAAIMYLVIYRHVG